MRVFANLKKTHITTACWGDYGNGNGFINTFSSSYANLQCVYKLGIKKVYIYMSIIKIKVLLIYINLQYV